MAPYVLPPPIIPKSRKAFRIKTKIHESADYGVYSAESAGAAKTMVVNAMKEIYRNASYLWIVSCRRCPEYDVVAQRLRGCIGWKHGNEIWSAQEAQP